MLAPGQMKRPRVYHTRSNQKDSHSLNGGLHHRPPPCRLDLRIKLDWWLWTKSDREGWGASEGQICCVRETRKDLTSKAHSGPSCPQYRIPMKKIFYQRLFLSPLIPIPLSTSKASCSSVPGITCWKLVDSLPLVHLFSRLMVKTLGKKGKIMAFYTGNACHQLLNPNITNVVWKILHKPRSILGT